MRDLTPREIVAELDRHIVGQHEAKRAVAIAVRKHQQVTGLERQLRSAVGQAGAALALGEQVEDRNLLGVGEDVRDVLLPGCRVDAPGRRELGLEEDAARQANGLEQLR